MKDKKTEKFEYSKKERLLISSLTAFVFSLIFMLINPMDLYMQNSQLLSIAFSDIIKIAVLFFIALFAVLFLILSRLKGTGLNILTAIMISVVISSAFSGLINNALSSSIISSAISVFIVYLFLMFGMFFKAKWKTALIALSVIVALFSIIQTGSSFTKGDYSKPSQSYAASEKGLLDVSNKENIIYFMFDRFDTQYHDEIVEKYPDFFDSLEGFTYFNNATCVFTRTFPSATYMLSGVEYTAEQTPDKYFEKAFTQSPFLADLKNNDYRLKLYVDNYYEYTNGNVLANVAENAEPVTTQKVSFAHLIKYFYQNSFANCIPIMKTRLLYSNSNGGKTVKLMQKNTESGIYKSDDKALFDKLNESGLTAQSNDKNYIFIVMNGSHFPFTLDENCEKSESATPFSQTVGAFKVILKYIDELKRLGVYDNSTIIISGDHGIQLSNDIDNYNEQTVEKGMTTAIFFKPKNSKGPIKTSDNGISASNMFASIVESAGIKTSQDYGKTVFEAESNKKRTLYQPMFDINSGKTTMAEYEITGDANDIKNWKVVKRTPTETYWY